MTGTRYGPWTITVHDTGDFPKSASLEHTVPFMGLQPWLARSFVGALHTEPIRAADSNGKPWRVTAYMVTEVSADGRVTGVTSGEFREAEPEFGDPTWAEK